MGSFNIWWAPGLVLGIPLLSLFVRMVMGWIRAVRVARRGPGTRIRPERRETRMEDLSQEMREFVGTVVAQFREEGFEVAANTTEEQAYSPGMQATQVILVNRAVGDVAVVVAVLSRVNVKGVISERRELSLNVASRFTDDVKISTWSRQTAELLRRDPGDDPVNASWVRDARVLCEFHRRRVRARGREGDERIIAEKGRELEYANDRRDKIMKAMVAAGWYYADEACGRYRLTWKGAVIVGLRLAKPFDRWRIKAERRRARREWVRLDMEAWRPASKTGADAERVSARRYVPSGSGQGDVQYEIGLRAGEVRVEQDDGFVIVRMGKPNATRLLLLKLPGILLLTLSCVGAAIYLGLALLIQAQVPNAFGGLQAIAALLAMVAVTAALLAWRIVAVARRFKRAQGVSTVVASRDGIEFRNTTLPGKPLFIAREEIQGLMLIPKKAGAVVHLRTIDGVRRVLLAGTNAQDVIRAKSLIVEAMGMSSEADGRLDEAAAAYNRSR